jgi:hypothetical protein
MMQVQPRYIALLMIVLLIAVLTGEYRAKTEQHQLEQEFLATKAVAERLSALQEGWHIDPKKLDVLLGRIKPMS